MSGHDYTASDRNRRWRARQMESLRTQFGGICGECGVEHGALLHFQNGNSLVIVLEFAHVAKTGLKGRGRGTSERIRDIKNNPEAYRLLCRPCHMALDFGFDPWEPRKPDPAQLELEEVPF